jgi:hypothetical protein
MSTALYRVLLQGVKPGFSKDDATSQIATLFKTSIDGASSILDKPGFIVKKGIDLQTATKYEAALGRCGCICSVEPEVLPSETLTLDIPPLGANSDLTDCKACATRISILADKCPSCGAPNDWIHPDIKRLLEVRSEIGTAEKFKLEWNNIEAWGKTRKKTSRLVSFLALLIFLGIYLPLGFLGTIGKGLGPINIFLVIGLALLMVVLLDPLFGKNKVFHANLQARSWTSSDDSFWQPVRSVLGFESITVAAQPNVVAHELASTLPKEKLESFKFPPKEVFIVAGIVIISLLLFAYVKFDIRPTTFSTATVEPTYPTGKSEIIDWGKATAKNETLKHILIALKTKDDPTLREFDNEFFLCISAGCYGQIEPEAALVKGKEELQNIVKVQPRIAIEIGDFADRVNELSLARDWYEIAASLGSKEAISKLEENSLREKKASEKGVVAASTTLDRLNSTISRSTTTSVASGVKARTQDQSQGITGDGENLADLNKLSKEERFNEQLRRIGKAVATAGSSTDFRASRPTDEGIINGFFIGTLKNSDSNYEIEVKDFNISFTAAGNDYQCGYYESIYVSLVCGTDNLFSPAHFYPQARKVCAADDVHKGTVGRTFYVPKTRVMNNTSSCKVIVHLQDPKGFAREKTTSDFQFGTHYYW